MYGTDPSSSSDSLDPRRRPRYVRRTDAGTATALRFTGVLTGLRSLLATLVASLERR